MLSPSRPTDSGSRSRSSRSVSTITQKSVPLGSEELTPRNLDYYREEPRGRDLPHSRAHRVSSTGLPFLSGNTMSQYSTNFLLVPIPEYPILDCAPNKIIKLVVLGGSGVGKTALIVRFLTKRFIGDYEANTGALYSRKFTIDGEQISLQVQDTPFVSLEDENDAICCQEQINRSIYWADGFVFVYSITDYDSYRVIRPLHQHIRKIHPNANIPLLLMANKGDLLRARQVSMKEGHQLANELGCTYSEVSARESCEGVHEAFKQLCQEMSRLISSCNGEKRRGLHLVRPKSPNMQDLKRRLKQALSSKGKVTTTL
ncbi:ras-like protein family member 11A-like [Rhineura floridana]|uniref:ras-like protein family member 11A-like n=1 Tax=Rhineura floridana TaxID=261503 RepID=UPI002AC83C02|nr:ras-like protein family member 11A-like [Rhineura floridana]